MECILCKTWSGTVYALRPTTPIDPREAEGLLTYGYWLGSREPRDEKGISRPVLCEKHFQILNQLDMKALPMPAAPLPVASKLVKPALSKAPPLPVANSPQSGSGVQGQGAPLPSASSEVIVSSAPSPVQSMVNAAIGAPASPPPPQPTPQKFPCPTCGTIVGLGEVHTC